MTGASAAGDSLFAELRSGGVCESPPVSVCWGAADRVVLEPLPADNLRLLRNPRMARPFIEVHLADRQWPPLSMFLRQCAFGRGVLPGSACAERARRWKFKGVHGSSVEGSLSRSLNCLAMVRSASGLLPTVSR